MADKALIIVAHGSRKASSNEEIKALGEKVKFLQNKHYTFVMTAFLEFTTPSLEESMLYCIDKNVSEIVILPYFRLRVTMLPEIFLKWFRTYRLHPRK